ncbi:gamma-glutamylcyclotransferase, partial [Halolamina salina]
MDVFVYGTLTEPERVASVVDAYAFLGSAVLSGLHPVQGEYPTLAPGGETGGRLLRTDDIDALDAYEGVDDGLYVRVSVPVERADSSGLDDTAAVYVGHPERLGVGDEVTWP